MTAESVLVLEPGDERAKKIGNAMASETASDLLSTLSEGELTLSELSERLGQPITTLKYRLKICWMPGSLILCAPDIVKKAV